jgi:hypothetical protein
MMVSRKTYRDAGSIRVYVKMTHMSADVARDLDQNPEPLAQGVGGKIVLVARMVSSRPLYSYIRRSRC